MSGFSNYEAHHQDRNSPESKSLVSKIWKVTALLSVVTIIEVGLGLWCYKSTAFPKEIANVFFVLLTLFKAGYIVSVFMHLGDELKGMIMTILIPLTLFIWFIIAFLYDGGFWLQINQMFR